VGLVDWIGFVWKGGSGNGNWNRIGMDNWNGNWGMEGTDLFLGSF